MNEEKKERVDATRKPAVAHYTNNQEILQPLQQHVLDESLLRFDLFPASGVRRTGCGLPSVLFEVIPRDLEKVFPTVKIHLRSVWDTFAKKTWETHPGMRMVWCGTDCKEFHETTLDITRIEHLDPVAWTQVCQWSVRDPVLPGTMLCDDVLGRQRRRNSMPAITHVLLHRVSEKLLSLPSGGGALYLLRVPPNVMHNTLMSPSSPVSVRVRIPRDLLARAAWLKLQKHCKARVTQRALRLDTCHDLNTYSSTILEDPRLKWTSCYIDNAGKPETLAHLRELINHWLGRQENGHVYCRKLTVYGPKAQTAPALYALVQFLVWVVLSRTSMRDFAVELEGIDEATEAVWRKLTPATAEYTTSVADEMQTCYGLVLKRDPLLLPSIKWVYMK